MLYQEGLDVGSLIFPLLIVSGICLIGLAIWVLLTLGKSKERSAPQSAEPHLADLQSIDPAFILAIRRSGTAWDIYVKGERATTANRHYDLATRKQALDALRQLARFARAYLTAEGSVASTATSPPLKEPRSDVVSAKPPLSRGAVLTADTSAGRSSFLKPGESPAVAPAVSGMNLADEIGAIVDEMMANTPALQNHAVDLVNAQTEGINFVVDGVIYHSVEEIPQPEIQELIRKATREWERR